MKRSFAGVAIAFALVAGSFVTAVPGNAGGTTDRNPSVDDYLTAAGKMGPRPSTMPYAVMLAPDEDDSVHINAKITCGDEHNGDHLHVHWGNLQFKAAVMEGAECSGEGDSGDAEGTVTGLCNGLPAFADFSFSTDEPTFDEPSTAPSRAAFAQGGSATIDVTGGCEIHGEPPFEGSIKFHDKSKDEEVTASTK